MVPRPSRKSSVKGVSGLASSAFAYPKTRSYPINTVKRARSALARASHSGNSGSYPHVARAVRKKWGNKIATVGPTHGVINRPGYKKKSRKRM